MGILYIALIFAVLHIGFLSFLDVAFVLLVALMYAALTKKTGSLVGVILSHGIANSFLFLVGPFILN
jgi:membrane protease YdiL (CAAX protease family)